LSEETLVMAGAVVSKVTLVLVTGVAALPKASLPAKTKVYTVPSTRLETSEVQLLVVSERLIVWAPTLSAVPLSVQVCGEFPSEAPEVRVIVMEPLANASSVVKVMSEEDVTLLIELEEAGVTEEKTGAVVSQARNVQPELLPLSVEP